MVNLQSPISERNAYLPKLKLFSKHNFYHVKKPKYEKDSESSIDRQHPADDFPSLKNVMRKYNEI